MIPSHSEHACSENAAAAQQCRDYLQALPSPDCPPTLWLRIERSRQSRRQRRIGISTGLLGVLLLAPMLWFAERPEPVSQAAIALPAAASLREIDRRLQAAYDSGAPRPQIEALWQARELAVSHPVLESSGHAAIIRL